MSQMPGSAAPVAMAVTEEPETAHEDDASSLAAAAAAEIELIECGDWNGIVEATSVIIIMDEATVDDVTTYAVEESPMNATSYYADSSSGDESEEEEESSWDDEDKVDGSLAGSKESSTNDDDVILAYPVETLNRCNTIINQQSLDYVFDQPKQSTKTLPEVLARVRQKNETNQLQGNNQQRGENKPFYYYPGPRDNGSTTIEMVLNTIGLEIYSCLHPNDLFNYSLCHHHTHEEISKNLIQAFMKQIPPNFGNYENDHMICFKHRHTFRNKDILLDYLLQKIETADLRICDEIDDKRVTQTLSMEESLIRAKEVLAREKKFGAKFVSYNEDLPPHLRSEFTSVGYHFQGDNKALATSRWKYILSRMKMVEDSSSKYGSLVKIWLDYILSQQHVVAGTYLWTCRHRNLDFQGVEGKGILITSPNAIDEEMEISWTRLTAQIVERS